MAGKRNGGTDGSFTIAGHNGDWTRFSADFKQQVDPAASYADKYWCPHHGDECIEVALSADGFQLFGDTDTSPNADQISADGATCTLQFATGCTLVGDFVLSDMNLSHSRKSGVEPISIKGMNAGDLVFAWAES